MANSLALVAPRNFILRIKIHCSKCEGKVKRFLLASPGVHSATIDAKPGTVAISATVEPATIMMLLEKGLGLKAELLWEQIPSSSHQDDIAESRTVGERFNDPDVVNQLQELSRLKGLKMVKVSYSETTKTMKLTFQGQNDDLNHKNVEDINIRDEDHNPEIITHAGSGLCGASTACCGGHHRHVVNPNMANVIVCGYCRQNHQAAVAAGFPIGSDVCGLHSCFDGNNMRLRPPHACGYAPPPSRPWSGGYSPSAPPIWTAGVYDAPPPPPPPPPARDTSFFNQFSDENTWGSCNIM